MHLSLPAKLAAAAFPGLLLLSPTSAVSAPGHCMTRILSDVQAEEAPEQVKSKTNGSFGPVTLIKVNKKTGRMVYCTKDSYCYWSNAFEFVSPCRIKRDETQNDEAYFSYFTR